MPNVAINQIFTSPDGGKLFVATHGRGMWELSTASLLITPSTPINTVVVVGSGGGGYSRTITVTNSGFTAMNCALDTTGMPSCLSLSGPTSGTLNSGESAATLTLTVDTSVVVTCTYNLNFTANGLITSATVPLSVEVEKLPTQASTVTLSDTSTNAPAFWTAGQLPPAGAPLAVLSWLGTDKAHHLNISRSTDGLTFTNKVTLGDTSIATPSVLVVNSNVVIIAWVGTNSAHSINVMYNVYGARKKVTFAESSGFSPSLAYYNGQVWLAWTGTDKSHSLNVMALGPQGLTRGTKVSLHQYSSKTSPRLVADPAGNQLLVTWTQLASPGHIELAYSANGTTWATPANQPSAQSSGDAPAVLAVALTPSGGHTYFWAWTGTNSKHSLNIMYAESLDHWSLTATFNASAIGSPSLGYPGASGATLLAWTDAGSSHHIKITTIQN